MTLLEISCNLPEAPRPGRARTVWFHPTRELPSHSAAIVLAPHDWQRVLAGDLRLPAGRHLAARRQVWPE